MEEQQVINEFKKSSIFRLNEGLRMIKISFQQIDEMQLWQLPFENGMCLGNQILHSCGNMRQYLISSLGNQTDMRNREVEFKRTPEIGKESLLALLEDTVAKSISTINTASVTEYLTPREVQGVSLSGLGAALHAVEHFSYHVGQTAFWVKYMTKQDLGFYNGVNLNKTNTANAD